MRAALTSRAVIDQAKGVVMADQRCTADEAFQHLVRLSNNTHRKVREVAQAIVDQVTPPRGLMPTDLSSLFEDPDLE
jgi:AmiR/NasT family two-component response regulator